MTTLTEDLAADKLQRMTNDELLAHLIERLPAIRNALRPAPMTDQTERDAVIDRLWEHANHGTRREDIEAAYDAGRKAALDGGAVSGERLRAAIKEVMTPDNFDAFDALLKHLRIDDGKSNDEVREKIARAMVSCSLATGHGDTVDDLLSELVLQIREFQIRLQQRDGGAVSQIRDAAENVVIAYGMGWDMEGVIEVLRAALRAPQRDSGTVSQPTDEEWTAFQYKLHAEIGSLPLIQEINRMFRKRDALRTPPQQDEARDLASAVAASLAAVLPLLKTVQQFASPGDHDETIARAQHNLMVFLASCQEKCNE